MTENSLPGLQEIPVAVIGNRHCLVCLLALSMTKGLRFLFKK